MTFLEALPLLVNRKRFRRLDWEPGVWFRHDGRFGPDAAVFMDQDGVDWEPMIPDMLSEWEVVE